MSLKCIPKKGQNTGYDECEHIDEKIKNIVKLDGSKMREQDCEAAARISLSLIAETPNKSTQKEIRIS